MKTSGNESGDELAANWGTICPLVEMIGADGRRRKIQAAGLELLDKTYINVNTKMKYKCRTCGLIHYINYNNMQQGKGCPHCLASHGEKLVSEFCKHYNIRFKPQYIFDNLRYKRNLRFDFGIIRDNQLLFLIEFNGIQHYKPREHFGGEPQFKLQQHLDNLKSTYCITHGIPLHIIKYDEDTTGRLNEIFQDYFGERMITKVKRLFSA